MSTAKRLAWIAAGYALAVAAGFTAVAVNELRMPEDVAQGSPGMVAFGDMILFMLVAGFFSLAPTWFLLRLCIEKIPRVLVAIELLAAAMGPASWLVLIDMVSGPPKGLPQVGGRLLGWFIAFVAIPRMVLGPVMLVIEAMTFVLVRERAMRALLVVAMLMDIIPLCMFALHMARATRY
jgi:hypothetical protein